MSYEDELNKIAPEMLLSHKKHLAVYYNSYSNGKVIKPLQQFFDRIKKEYGLDDGTLLEIAKQCWKIVSSREVGK
jgi:hypothetical protein